MLRQCWFGNKGSVKYPEHLGLLFEIAVDEEHQISTTYARVQLTSHGDVHNSEKNR
jgi:hypothetical protein